MFWHPKRNLSCSVHGDNFTTVGPKSSLDWFVDYFKSKQEIKKSARMSPTEEGDKEGRALDKIMRWTNAGIKCEGDPRQVERLVKQLGLEDAKPASTLGAKVSQEQINSDVPLELEKVTHFRGLAAHFNYLTQHRVSILGK